MYAISEYFIYVIYAISKYLIYVIYAISEYFTYAISEYFILKDFYFLQKCYSWSHSYRHSTEHVSMATVP
jgi:hypothetical protein